MEIFKWLEKWYSSKCDGEWENYYGIKINTLDNPESDFYKVDMDLSIMTSRIECKNILVEKIYKESLNLFWKNN